MRTAVFVTLLGAVLFACGSGEPESAPAPSPPGPLMEPCMSAPDDPAPAWDGHTICHLPPGNPGNAHTLSVGAPAVSAHLAHGDTLGPCGGGGGGPGECQPLGATCSGSANECCAGLFCMQPSNSMMCAEDSPLCTCVLLE